MIKEKTSFYVSGSNSSLNSTNINGVLIKITCGDVKGFTEFINGCPSLNSEKERGSIIINKNLNRIEVLSIIYKGYGTLVHNVCILDPPKPPNKCVCYSDCKPKKDICDCPLTPVEQGIVKPFLVFVPPGVDEFIIHLRAFQNWRYGCPSKNSVGESVKKLNCGSNFQSTYRFAWHVNITKNNNNVYPIYALGPHLNYEVEKEVCVTTNNTTNNTSTTTNVDPSLESSIDNLVVSNVKKNKSKKKCCTVVNESGETENGICVQPHYNNAYVDALSISSVSALIEATYTAGAGSFSSGNADLGFCFNQSNLSLGLGFGFAGAQVNNLTFCLTTSATFIIIDNNKCTSTSNSIQLDTGNLFNLFRTNIYGVLTLFTNNIECN
jgi:hypothetical protein